jgi:hypothetical protein
VIGEHRDKLDALANMLVEVETLEGDDLLRVLGPTEGRRLPAHPEDVAVLKGDPTPPAVSGESEGEEQEEGPRGRPGLAWGQQHIAPPPAE